MKSQLRCKLQEHSLLLQRIEAVPDLQCAWLILMFCAAARANCFRVVHPGSSEEFARQHDAAIWQVFLQLLNITGGQETRDLASSRSPSSPLAQLGRLSPNDSEGCRCNYVGPRSGRRRRTHRSSPSLPGAPPRSGV